MSKGFKGFVLRGNVVDLAVAVIIGTAFTAVIKAIVADLITPLIAAIIGKPSFAALRFTVHGSTFLYGDVVNNVLTFLAIAAVVYFFVVAPISAISARVALGEGTPEEVPPDIALLGEIRDLLASRPLSSEKST